MGFLYLKLKYYLNLVFITSQSAFFVNKTTRKTPYFSSLWGLQSTIKERVAWNFRKRLDNYDEQVFVITMNERW